MIQSAQTTPAKPTAITSRSRRTCWCASTPAARSVRSSGRGRPSPPPTRSRRSPVSVACQIRTPLIPTPPPVGKDCPRPNGAAARARVWTSGHAGKTTRRVACAWCRSGAGRAAGERGAGGLGGERAGRVRERHLARHRADGHGNGRLLRDGSGRGDLSRRRAGPADVHRRCATPAAWCGGFAPGLIATARSTILAGVVHPSPVTDVQEVAGLLLFTLVNALIVALLTGLQRARRRAEVAARRSAFLAEAGSVLASSLDFEPTLQTLARLVVPFLADWCSVDVMEEDGSVRRIALVHENPAKADIARP